MSPLETSPSSAACLLHPSPEVILHLGKNSGTSFCRSQCIENNIEYICDLAARKKVAGARGKVVAQKSTASVPVGSRLAASAPAAPSAGGRGPASSGADARGFSSAAVPDCYVCSDIIDLSCSESGSHAVSATRETAQVASMSSYGVSEDESSPDPSRLLCDPWVLGRPAMPWEQLPRPAQGQAPASFSRMPLSPWSGAAQQGAQSSDAECSPSPLPLRQRLAAQLRPLPAVQAGTTTMRSAMMVARRPASPYFGQPVTPLEGCGRQECTSRLQALPAAQPHVSPRCRQGAADFAERESSKNRLENLIGVSSPEIISLITP